MRARVHKLQPSNKRAPKGPHKRVQSARARDYYYRPYRTSVTRIAVIAGGPLQFFPLPKRRRNINRRWAWIHADGIQIEKRKALERSNSEDGVRPSLRDLGGFGG